MDKLNSDKLFSIFQQDDTQFYQEHDLEEVTSIPFIKLGMVVTGVENYNTMHNMYSSRLKQSYDLVKDAIKYKYYSKLLQYLLSVSAPDAQQAYNKASDLERQKALPALNNLINYFESIEHFEKCSKMMPYLHILQQGK